MEKFSDASILKDDANTLFKEGNFDGALRKYHEALMHVLHTTSDISRSYGERMSDSERDQINDLIVACYANLAMCLSKKGRWDRVVINCNKALEIQPNHAKALYRRAVAYIELGEIFKAESDLAAAGRAAPEEPAIRHELRRIAAMQSRSEEQAKQMYRAMFTPSEQ
eukprot:Opistho-2@68503